MIADGKQAEAIGLIDRQLVQRRSDIADVFPIVVAHAERPLLRAAPAPMFLLSRLVRDSGIKVVLTGEGADEMFAGYDLFREGRARGERERGGDQGSVEHVAPHSLLEKWRLKPMFPPSFQ